MQWLSNNLDVCTQKMRQTLWIKTNVAYTKLEVIARTIFNVVHYKHCLVQRKCTVQCVYTCRLPPMSNRMPENMAVSDLASYILRSVSWFHMKLLLLLLLFFSCVLFCLLALGLTIVAVCRTSSCNYIASNKCRMWVLSMMLLSSTILISFIYRCVLTERMHLRPTRAVWMCTIKERSWWFIL